LRFDPPLTPVGREQAKDTARRLSRTATTTVMKPLPSMVRQPSQVEVERVEAAFQAAGGGGEVTSSISRSSVSSPPPTSPVSAPAAPTTATHATSSISASGVSSPSWSGTGVIDEKTSDAITAATSKSDVTSEKEAKRLRAKQKKEWAKSLKYDRRNAKRAVKQLKEGHEHPIHHIYSSPFTR
jgi:hypothetical protein